MANNTCEQQITKVHYDQLAYTRGSSATIPLIFSLALLVYLLRRLCKSVARTTSLEWITVYIAAFISINSSFLLISLIDDIASTGGGYFCRAIAILLTWVSWMENECVLLLCYHYMCSVSCSAENFKLSVNNLKDEEIRQNEDQIMAHERKESRRNKRIHHCALLLMWLPLPVLTIWAPFQSETKQIKNGTEGYCWKVSINHNDRLKNFEQEVVMQYIPTIFTGVIVLCIAIATFMDLCYRCTKNCRRRRKRYCSRVEITVVCVFALYGLLCGVEVASRLVSITLKDCLFGLWIAYEIMGPLENVILLIGCSLVLIRYNMIQERRKAARLYWKTETLLES